MKSLSHRAGVIDALNTFAATKLAGSFMDGLSAVREEMFGHPIEAAKQLHRGTLLKPGTGLYATGLPRTPSDLAKGLAVPLAMTALFAKMTPKENRGELVGDAVGNIAGSLLGRPLAGAVGQVGGGMLLSNVGRELGKKFDTLTASRKSDVAVNE